MKMRGIDARLFTIAPALEAIIRQRRGPMYNAPSASCRAEIVKLARQAVGSYNGPMMPRRNWKQSRVVYDWMARFALPLWLDQLPGTLGPKTAEQLRGLAPLLWPVQIAAAVQTLTPVWSRLVDLQDKLTEVENVAIARVLPNVQIAMEVLTSALADGVPRYPLDEAAAFRCGRALLADQRDALGAQLWNHIPKLVSVLLEVRSGDSQQSVADRCVWPAPAREKAA